MSVATYSAVAATAAFLISGGIWLGQLQSKIDEHTDMLAHIDAGKRLNQIELDLIGLETEIQSMDSLLHNLSSKEEERHADIMRRLELMGWQPYLREE